MKWVNLASGKLDEGFGTGVGNNNIHFKTYLGNKINYDTWWLTSNNTVTFNQTPRPSQVLSIDSVYWLDESGPPEGYERIDVKIGSYIMPPPTEYMEAPKAEYPSLEYVVLTELHDNLIEKYETLLAKYNKLKSKK